ncbi:hypothetical protein LCGC14_2380840, partial [marine sediment metagenome]
MSKKIVVHKKDKWFYSVSRAWTSRRSKDSRIGSIHGELAGTRRLVDFEHQFPCRAAVAGSVDPPFLCGAVWRALRRNVNEIRVSGMDANAGDGPGQFEPHVMPGSSGIGGLVNTVSVRCGDTSHRMLTHPHVHHIGIGFGYCNSS